MEQYFSHVDRVFAWLVTVWVPLSIIVNFVLDRVVCVPADSSPEWKDWGVKHPNAAGWVKFWRGLGLDSIKFGQGLWMGLTGRNVDPSAKGKQS